MKVLVDTPVWSLALRRDAGALNPEQAAMRQALAELIAECRIVILGPIRQELLSGIRNESAFLKLRERLRAFDDEKLQTPDFERAAEFFNTCRARGVTGTPTDLLLCAVAERLNAAILTTDADFRRYASILGVRLHAPNQGR